MRVGIVGGGIMGASAALALTRRGHQATIFDTEFPNPRGASYGDTRLFRMAYFEHPHYVPLLRESVEGWRALESATDTHLYHAIGAIYVGQSEGELIRGSELSASTHGLAYERLSAAEIGRRWPVLSVPADSVGFLDQAGGYILATSAVSATLRAALERGARIRSAEVLDVDTQQVFTETDVFEYDRVIVCVGPWSNRFLDDLGLDIRPTRQILSWTTPTDPTTYANLPVFGLEDPDGEFWYGAPPVSGGHGLKFAGHRPGPPVGPNRFDPACDPRDDEQISGARSRWFPHLRGEVALRACMYTMTPDGHFRLGFRPDGVVYGAGFSGHGFKFGPAIGNVLAEMAESGATPDRAAFLAGDSTIAEP